MRNNHAGLQEINMVEQFRYRPRPRDMGTCYSIELPAAEGFDVALGLRSDVEIVWVSEKSRSCGCETGGSAEVGNWWHSWSHSLPLHGSRGRFFRPLRIDPLGYSSLCPRTSLFKS